MCGQWRDSCGSVSSTDEGTKWAKEEVSFPNVSFLFFYSYIPSFLVLEGESLITIWQFPLFFVFLFFVFS